jgi:hypothetical protein
MNQSHQKQQVYHLLLDTVIYRLFNLCDCARQVILNVFSRQKRGNGLLKRARRRLVLPNMPMMELNKKLSSISGWRASIEKIPRALKAKTK